MYGQIYIPTSSCLEWVRSLLTSETVPSAFENHLGFQASPWGPARPATVAYSVLALNLTWGIYEKIVDIVVNTV